MNIIRRGAQDQLSTVVVAPERWRCAEAAWPCTPPSDQMEQNHQHQQNEPITHKAPLLYAAIGRLEASTPSVPTRIRRTRYCTRFGTANRHFLTAERMHVGSRGCETAADRPQFSLPDAHEPGILADMPERRAYLEQQIKGRGGPWHRPPRSG